MSIKNIIFDLGGVILKNKPISVLEKLDIAKEVYDDLKVFFTDWKDLNLGKESLEDKYNKCNFPKEYDKLYKKSLINYYKIRDINIELINCINELKKNNYNIYILSNNNKEAFNYYKNDIRFKNIDGWVVSCEYQTIKEDGIIFDILINKYKLDVKECYYIDDKISNIREALKHGIKGYIYDDNINNLYTEMRNNNIKI